MPAPAAATVAAKAAIAVLKSRRGRRMLLAALAGVLLGVGLIVVVLLSSVNAVVASCRADAQAAENATALPGGGGSSSAAPSYVSEDWSEEALSDIPEDYLPLYEKAAQEYGLDQAILAAIGKIESDHGRYGGSCAESYAGAQGPMQFIPSTWANVGVDGNGDGTKDVCDPEDAIPSAANYLKLSGAPQDYHSAILAYNHSEAYYQDVVAQAEAYRGSGSGGGGEPGGESAASGARSGLAALVSPLAMRPAHAQSSGTVGSPGETDYSSTEIDALGIINDYREENGLRPLELSDKLSTASAHYAHDMAKYDAYGEPEPHISGPTDYYFQGATLTDRMNEEGYYAQSYGENIAAGQDTGQKVFEAWRNSPPHNEMMLNPEMTTIGVALVTSDSASFDSFWVTDFGSDKDDTTRPVSEAGSGSGGGAGGTSGGSEVAGNSEAVFPLPEEHFGSYEDTWGASRSGGRTHEGTDMFAPDGTPIYSITSGKVMTASGADSRGWNEMGGWTIMVEVTETVGPIEAGDTLYYAHMLEPASLKPGDTVAPGDQIGKVGSTGEGPPGTILPDGRGEHLHLGWYTDENSDRAEAASGAMNPYPMLEWLRENGGTATGGGSLAPAPSTAELPAYCAPLQALGLVPTVAEGSELSSPMGTEGTGGDATQGGGGGSGSATGDQVIEEAKKYIGVPYVLGGLEACVPGEQMDCTCLTRTVYGEFGFDLPDCPTCLWDYGEEVPGEPQSGDLMVWDDPGDGTGGHAAIAMGDGSIIHANMATMDTQITPMWDSPQYLGARNLVN